MRCSLFVYSPSLAGESILMVEEDGSSDRQPDKMLPARALANFVQFVKFVRSQPVEDRVEDASQLRTIRTILCSYRVEEADLMVNHRLTSTNRGQWPFGSKGNN
jgi:hypothetical protein